LLGDHMDIQKGEFSINTDKTKLDYGIIHRFLRESYWAEGIPLKTVKKGIENSLCFGVYHQGRQIGFARVITDYATYAYLGDVFILANYRGRGLSKWLVEVITGHPELQGLRRWMLATRDAHGLYVQFGFKGLKAPDRWMEKHNPDVYRR
jgi:GNAT superfamily N-acetyltransferase